MDSDRHRAGSLLLAKDPSVHLRPRPNPLFCLSFRVWRMFYSMKKYVVPVKRR